MSQKLRKFKRRGEHVTRFKGLGEMNASELEEHAFNPETRKIVQMTVSDAAEAQETLNLIMGNRADRRRAWLEDVGLRMEPEAETELALQEAGAERASEMAEASA